MANKLELTEDEKILLESFEIACTSTIDMLTELREITRAEAKKIMLEYLEAAAITEKLPGVL